MNKLVQNDNKKEIIDKKIKLTQYNKFIFECVSEFKIGRVSLMKISLAKHFMNTCEIFFISYMIE